MQLANQSYDQLWGQGPLVASMPREVGGNETVVYHTRAAHAFSAGMKCRHCSENDSKIQDGRQPAETGQNALSGRLTLLNVLMGVFFVLDTVIGNTLYIPANNHQIENHSKSNEPSQQGKVLWRLKPAHQALFSGSLVALQAQYSEWYRGSAGGKHRIAGANTRVYRADAVRSILRETEMSYISLQGLTSPWSGGNPREWSRNKSPQNDK